MENQRKNYKFYGKSKKKLLILFLVKNCVKNYFSFNCIVLWG